MADAPSTVALNIGSQRISIAVFETSKTGGLVLKSYGSESIVADPSMEAGRSAQTRVAVAELVSRMKIDKSKVRYAISGQSALTKFVKLPPLQDDNIEQLVVFEAQQHVPFPLAEVVWDYELVEGGAEKEAVIVAIKGDILDDINSTVNDASLSTQEVDVAPMALYNSYRATYGIPEEPTLLIDIGAKTSNLLYIEGKRFFTRSINKGGASITAAIAKEYNVSFAEAEHQKVVNGLCALGGGHTEQLEESVAALAMVIRNAMSSLPSEIARTTNYYRSQHGGSAPRRVLLAGGGANLPYTLEFFEEKLNLPVEYFNPVRNVVIGKNVDVELVQREGHLMGELVGLGLRGIGKSEINIDLVPLVVEQARTANRRKPFFIAAAATVLIGFGVWAVGQNLAASQAAKEAAALLGQKETFEPIKAEIEKLQKRETKIMSLANQYVNAEADHSYWVDALSDLSNAFASDCVWITSFEPVYNLDFAVLMKGDKTKKAYKSAVKPDFYRATYGVASMEKVVMPPSAAAPASGKGKKNAVVETKPSINAIVIKGFWRPNSKDQNLVIEMLKKLRDKSDNFQFVIPNPEKPSEKIDLLDGQFLQKITPVMAGGANKDGELASPFEIILPLSREVTMN